jgi:hypothetical protein
VCRKDGSLYQLVSRSLGFAILGYFVPATSRLMSCSTAFTLARTKTRSWSAAVRSPLALSRHVRPSRLSFPKVPRDTSTVEEKHVLAPVGGLMEPLTNSKVDFGVANEERVGNMTRP